MHKWQENKRNLKLGLSINNYRCVHITAQIVESSNLKGHFLLYFKTTNQHYVIKYQRMLQHNVIVRKHKTTCFGQK
jgi:hypothetical protein